MIQAAPAALESLSAQDLLAWAIDTYGRGFCISTSFQSEGMVLVDMAARISRDVRVITLDTGRLPEETHAMIDGVRERYGLTVEVVLPDHMEVERLVSRHGVNAFRTDPALRRLCCEIRKVRPLDRKLRDMKAWAVGLRRGQSEERAGVAKADFSGERVKLSPLADWSAAEVEAYTREHDVPRHPLYARGYTSIGCGPCTRAIAPGEDERAGRWWWELDSAKECGIHFGAGGKVERTVDVLLRELLQDA